MIFPPTSLIKTQTGSGKPEGGWKGFSLSTLSVPHCANIQGFPELLKLPFLDPLPGKFNRSFKAMHPETLKINNVLRIYCTPSTEILRDYEHSLIRRRKEHCTLSYPSEPTPCWPKRKRRQVHLQEPNHKDRLPQSKFLKYTVKLGEEGFLTFLT